MSAPLGNLLQPFVFKLQRVQNRVPPHDWQLPKAHADPPFASGFKNSENEAVYNIGQGEDQHMKYEA
jgi:hypothetical protein